MVLCLRLSEGRPGLDTWDEEGIIPVGFQQISKFGIFIMHLVPAYTLKSGIYEYIDQHTRL